MARQLFCSVHCKIFTFFSQKKRSLDEQINIQQRTPAKSQPPTAQPNEQYTTYENPAGHQDKDYKKLFDQIEAATMEKLLPDVMKIIQAKINDELKRELLKRLQFKHTFLISESINSPTIFRLVPDPLTIRKQCDDMEITEDQFKMLLRQIQQKNFDLMLSKIESITLERLLPEFKELYNMREESKLNEEQYKKLVHES